MARFVSKANLIFMLLLIGPSMILYPLSHVDSTATVDNLAAAGTYAAITVCPFTGALYFGKSRSIYLSLLAPLVLTVTKAINFEGAERLVVVGFLVFLVFSTLACALGWLVKYSYRRYRRDAI